MTQRTSHAIRRPESSPVGLPADRTPAGWSWQWAGWASWPVSPAVLFVAALALVGDLGSTWLGQPEWYLGRVLVSPVLPLVVVLVLLVGPGRLGGSRRTLTAWREFLRGAVCAACMVALAYAQTVSGWHEVAGVVVTSIGEEVVYRIGAVLLVGAACARLAGRDWRDTARWGSGPILTGIVGAALVFSVLPGHVEQMSDLGTVVPFASLAILLGYVSLRTGSIVPAIVTHVLLDLLALTAFAGAMGESSRLVAAGAVLVALAVALRPAGRRLGLRRRVPVVIDLTDASGSR